MHCREKGRSEDFPKRRQADGAASTAPPRHRQRTSAPADAWKEPSRNGNGNGRSWQGSERDHRNGGGGGRDAEETSGWGQDDRRSAGPSARQRDASALPSNGRGNAAWSGDAGAQEWSRDAGSQPHPSWRGRSTGSRERGGAGTSLVDDGGGGGERRPGRDGDWRRDRGDAPGARGSLNPNPYQRGGPKREQGAGGRPMAGNGGGGAGRLFGALRGEALYGVNPVVGALEAGRRRVFTLYVQDGAQIDQYFQELICAI